VCVCVCVCVFSECVCACVCVCVCVFSVCVCVCVVYDPPPSLHPPNTHLTPILLPPRTQEEFVLDRVSGNAALYGGTFQGFIPSPLLNTLLHDLIVLFGQFIVGMLGRV
jgi:hypothetical protein